MSRKTVEAEVVTPETKTAEHKDSPKQSQLATILIGLLIIASGLLVYNYFQTATAPETVVVNQDDQKSDAEQVPGGTLDADKKQDSGSYTVVAGDTLWSIAEKIYGDGHRWTELDQANTIARNSLGQPMVEIGQVLKAPNSAATVDTSQDKDQPEDKVADKDKPAPSSPGAAKAQSYTVVSGDTLWSIAEAHYGDGQLWSVIFDYESNNLGSLPDGTPLIHAGNVLVIPPVLPGD